MALAKEQYSEIVEVLRAELPQILAEQSLGKPPVVYEIELRERMVRVEEELKHQRELIKDSIETSNKHFERVDKRFEEMQANMDRRFEQVDKRFEQVDKRFEQIDKRFEELLTSFNKRFIFLQWLITLGFLSFGVYVTIIKFLLSK